MFKKLFKKRKKKVVLKKDDHVASDWATALIVFIVITVLLIGLSFLIYFQINNSEQVDLESASDVELIDQELLNEVNSFYDLKVESFIRFQDEIPPVPSI